MRLFPESTAPPVPGVDLRRASIADVLPMVTGARLVHADPPWTYRNSGNRGNASDQYDLLTIADIAEHVDAAYDSAADDAYLLCWATFPTLGEWLPALLDTRWRYVTGGAWTKSGGLGIGYHFRGDVEPLLVAVKGKPRPSPAVSSAHVAPRQRHSVKPAGWLAGLVESFTAPGDLVLDMYAGLGPMARACVRTHRRYVGAEIDEDRHRSAMARIATQRLP